MNGVDLLTVKELMGHKNIEMTLRYSHLSCDHKKHAVRALDVLNGTKLAQKDTGIGLSPLLSNGYRMVKSGL